MQFRSLLAAIGVALSVASPSLAAPIVINDNFVGGAPTHPAWNGVDIIGDRDKYDVERMEVSVVGGLLTVDIFSTYFDNVGSHGTALGDLFISTNGWKPFGAAPYTQDTASNGEKWEFALRLSNYNAGLGTSGTASLYNLANGGSIVLSDALNNPSTSIFRGNQEVQFSPGQSNAVAFGTWSITNLLGGTDKLTFSIALSALGPITDDMLGLHWAMTCGNDVIEGAAPVPEPGTLLLLGGGMLGACLRKRVSRS